MENIKKYLKNIKPRKYQKDIYKTCKKNNCLVVLPTGLGKCIEFSQPVPLENGLLIEIGRLFEKNKKDLIKDTSNHKIIKPKKDISVLSSNNNLKLENQKIIGIHKIKATKPLLKITTYSGSQITVTAEHPLLTLEDGLKWKKAKKLKKGNSVATPKEIPEPKKDNSEIDLANIFSNINYNVICIVGLSEKFRGKYRLKKEEKLKDVLKKKVKKEEINKNIKYIYIKGGKSAKQKIKPVKRTSKDLMYWVGLFLGEGSMYGTSKFYNINKNILKKFKNISKKIFGLEAKKIKGGLKIPSTALHFFLRNLFDMTSRQRSKEKSISNFAMRQNNEKISALLSGLYDAEGSVRKDGLIEFMTASEKLANNLCYLLLRFKIHPRISEKKSLATNSNNPKKRLYYRIYIQGKKDLKTFKEKIGFKHEKKRRKLKNYLKRKIRHNPNFDLVPNCGKLVKKIRKKLNLSSTKWKDFDIPGIDTYERGERQFSHLTLKKTIEGFEKHLNYLKSLKKDFGYIKKQIAILSKTPKEIFKKLDSNLLKKHIKKLGIDKKLFEGWKKGKIEPRLQKDMPFIKLIQKLPKKTCYSNFNLKKVKKKSQEFMKKINFSKFSMRKKFGFCCIPSQRKELRSYLKTIIKEYKEGKNIEKDVKNLKKLLKSDIYWDKIKKIEKIRKKWVYDLTLEKSHNFIAGKNGGFISHNTLIALMLTIDRLAKFPETKVLLVAPTRPLAEQHLNYFKKHLPELFASIILFTGKTRPKKRMQLWEKNDIILSTPQCISNDIEKGLYSLKKVSLLIEDECHRCIKNYSYTSIAKKYKEHAENQKVLGITASPGHEKKRLKKICKNLNIQTIEARTRKSKDVKKYLQERKFNTIKIDFPKELDEIKQLLKKIFDKKVKELKNRKLLFKQASKKNLLNCQKRIMKAIASGNKHFNYLAGASACAVTIKLQHALELLETQTLSSLQLYFQDLFDQAKQKKSKAVQKLVKKQEFNLAYAKLVELIAKNKEHPKLEKIKQIVEKELQDENNKVMIFAQFRNTVTKICKEINSIEKANARVFVGQAKKTSGKGKNKKTSGLSQQEQQELLKKFALGKINVLVSTSVGEEGLDISEMGHVIFYEPIPSTIRTIQRRGRTARLKPGKITFLITKKTRDEGYYWAAFHREKKMHKALKSMKKDLEDKEKQETLS